jgi:hypothetical protein
MRFRSAASSGYLVRSVWRYSRAAGEAIAAARGGSNDDGPRAIEQGGDDVIIARRHAHSFHSTAGTRAARPTEFPDTASKLQRMMSSLFGGSRKAEQAAYEPALLCAMANASQARTDRYRSHQAACRCGRGGRAELHLRRAVAPAGPHHSHVANVRLTLCSLCLFTEFCLAAT